MVQDSDGIIGPNDVEESDVIRHTPAQPSAPDNLVGRPLAEVERYCSEQALLLTEGNRKEAAHLLGIPERTLYRMIQDWKLQDQVRQALRDASGNLAEAARLLSLKQTALERKIKKWGWQPDKLPAGV